MALLPLLDVLGFRLWRPVLLPLVGARPHPQCDRHRPYPWRDREKAPLNVCRSCFNYMITIHDSLTKRRVEGAGVRWGGGEFGGAPAPHLP